VRWWWLARPKHRQRHWVDRCRVIRILWFNDVRIVWVAYLRVIGVDALRIRRLDGIRIGLDRVGSVRINGIGKHGGRIRGCGPGCASGGVHGGRRRGRTDVRAGVCGCG
jgi:hypothetical protein